MTSDMLPLLVIVLVVCCIALIWFYLDAQQEDAGPKELNTENREQVIEMLAQVGDHFTMSIYQKVYNIDTREIESKKRAIKKHH